jgi:hypothetical protein
MRSELHNNKEIYEKYYKEPIHQIIKKSEKFLKFKSEELKLSNSSIENGDLLKIRMTNMSMLAS